MVSRTGLPAAIDIDDTGHRGVGRCCGVRGAADSGTNAPVLTRHRCWPPTCWCRSSSTAQTAKWLSILVHTGCPRRLPPYPLPTVSNKFKKYIHELPGMTIVAKEGYCWCIRKLHYFPEIHYYSNLSFSYQVEYHFWLKFCQNWSKLYRKDPYNYLSVA